MNFLPNAWKKPSPPPPPRLVLDWDNDYTKLLERFESLKMEIKDVGVKIEDMEKKHRRWWQGYIIGSVSTVLIWWLL